MGRPKLAKQEIIKQVESLGLKFIDFIIYDGKNSKFYVECPYKHSKYETSLTILKKGRKAMGCPQCKSLNKTKTNIDRVGYLKVVKYIQDCGFTILTSSREYKGVSTLLDIKCSKGHNQQVSYEVFKKRVTKCVECYQDEKLCIAKNKASKLGYVLHDNTYIGKNMHLDITCDKGHKWHPTYDSFIYADTKCLHCQYSRGEDMIEDILNKYHIMYIKQYRFHNCFYKRLLTFDFFLPYFNMCIEYDGIQHFQPLSHFGGYERYIDLRVKDIIKNEYCKEHNINLVRIGYFNFDNIESLLKSKLNLNE